MLTYKVPNVGKMTTAVYINDILPQIVNDFQEQGLTLCQDANLAHQSKATLEWANNNNLPLITLPSVSPDFSIAKMMANLLKKAFHRQQVMTEKTALAHFKRIFEEEMDQSTIQNLYYSYTKRLHNCRRASGQMTKY